MAGATGLPEGLLNNGVTPHEYNRVYCLLCDSGISDFLANRIGAFLAANDRCWVLDAPVTIGK